MRIVLQRVSEAAVEVDGEPIGRIGKGLLLLVGFTHDDGEDFAKAINKVINFRIFPDDDDRLNLALNDVGGEVLLVPQFTLYAATHRGRRPDFVQAMKPDLATVQFDKLVDGFRAQLGDRVQTGRFGADMKVSLINDGPFTLPLEFET